MTKIKYFPPQRKLTEQAPPPTPVLLDPPVGKISLDWLIGRHILMIYRETRTLLENCSGGRKLCKEDAQCLRDNLKLLLELKDREKDLLEGFEDAELEKRASNDSIETSGGEGTG